MNLQEFKDHTSKNTIHYFKVVEHLVKVIDEAKQDVDNLQSFEYTKDVLDTLDSLLEVLIKKHTHKPKKKYQ